MSNLFDNHNTIQEVNEVNEIDIYSSLSFLLTSTAVNQACSMSEGLETYEIMFTFLPSLVKVKLAVLIN